MIETPEQLRWFMIQTTVAAEGLLLVFALIEWLYGKNSKQEKRKRGKR